MSFDLETTLVRRVMRARWCRVFELSLSIVWVCALPMI
jgi:hypothetical protein